MAEQTLYLVETEHSPQGMGMVTPEAYKSRKWDCKVLAEGTFTELLAIKKNPKSLKN